MRTSLQLDYTIESESKADVVIVDIGVPRYLDSSLIDLDVHPTYISVVVKGKTLRLHLPEEVRYDLVAVRCRLEILSLIQLLGETR